MLLIICLFPLNTASNAILLWAEPFSICEKMILKFEVKRDDKEV